MNIVARLLLSLLLVVGAGTIGVNATRALLSDQAVLSANTFTTGTMNLLVAKGQTGGTFEESQAGFSGSIIPGQTITNYLRLKNDSADINFAVAAQAFNIGGDISADDVTITFTPVDSSEDPEGSPVTHSLSEWSASLDALGTPNIGDGETQEYQMDVTLSPSIASTGTASFDFTFTGTQTP